MTCHGFQVRLNNQIVKVILGWDRAQQRYYSVIKSMGVNKVLYTSRTDDDFINTVSYITGVCKRFKISIPDHIIGRLHEDMSFNRARSPQNNKFEQCHISKAQPTLA